MPWNWMQLMDHAEDCRVESMMESGEMTFEEARAAIQSMIDGLVPKFPDLATVAERWRQDTSDNTVSYLALTWTVFQHEPGEVHAGAHVRLEEATARDRADGFDAQVARPRS